MRVKSGKMNSSDNFDVFPSTSLEERPISPPAQQESSATRLPSTPSTHQKRPSTAERVVPTSSTNFPPAIFIIFAILVLNLSAVPRAFAQNSARCYFFGPGSTIPGSDYRRDYGIERKACAETCKFDACCLAFEWREKDGICTLKSRSLNGTVGPASEDTYFGLCLDYDDAERDRFWDHEMHGPSSASVARISRDKCSAMCAATVPTSAAPATRKRAERALSAEAVKGNAVIYSWKTENERDVDTVLGTCQCITVLNAVRLSFGSFSGFLV